MVSSSWSAAAVSQVLSRCSAGFQRAQLSVMEPGRFSSGRGPRCSASLRRRHRGWCRIGNGMIGRADRAMGWTGTLGIPKQVTQRTWWPLSSFLTGLGCPSGPHSPCSPLQMPLQGARGAMHTLSRAPGSRVASGGGWVPLCLQTLPELLFLYLSVALLHTRLTSVGAQ